MSKDTAQQEVEKVCFAYEKAGKTGNKKDWGKFYDLEDSLINKVEVANQTKLSIPKKIADSIVKLAKYHQKAAAVNGDVFGILDATEWLVNFMSAGRESVMNPELFDYLNQDKSGHIETCIAFMNPLTRPFVEVEG